MDILSQNRYIILLSKPKGGKRGNCDAARVKVNDLEMEKNML